MVDHTRDTNTPTLRTYSLMIMALSIPQAFLYEWRLGTMFLFLWDLRQVDCQISPDPFKDRLSILGRQAGSRKRSEFKQTLTSGNITHVLLVRSFNLVKIVIPCSISFGFLAGGPWWDSEK